MKIKNKGKVFYQYKGGDEKVSKLVVDTAGPKFLWTHYIGDLVYEAGVDGIDTLRYILTEEGRIRLIYKQGQPVSYAFDYFLRDHLGSVRALLTTKSDTAVYAATMEMSASAVESALFNNINNTRDVKPTVYPVDNTTNPNQYVARLNASENKKIGPARVLRVMAGDTISIVCKTLYKNTTDSVVNSSSPGMVADIIQAFSAGSVTEGIHAGTGSSSPISFLSSSIYDALKAKDPNQNVPTQPKAYLNFAAFDDQFNLVDENSGIRQVKGLVDSLITLSVVKMVIKRTGFIYIYTSNESSRNVYFDNLIITHLSGPLLEETHYNILGKPLNSISSAALKKYPENSYLYNSKEKESHEFLDKSGLDWYSYDSRKYDYKISRWLATDPLAEKFYERSPYVYSFNNQLNFIDKKGEAPVSASYTLTGSAAQSAFRSIQHAYLSNPPGKRFVVHFVLEFETPEIYQNTINALKAGKSPWLHYAGVDPKAKKLRRDAATEPPKKELWFRPQNYSWDEYPYACTIEGGQNPIVKAVPEWEQRIQGNRLSQVILNGGNKLKRGDVILVIPISGPQKEESYEPNPDISGWLIMQVLETILNKFAPPVVSPIVTEPSLGPGLPELSPGLH